MTSMKKLRESLVARQVEGRGVRVGLHDAERE